MTVEQSPAGADSTTRLLIDRFNGAFNRHDADALERLLTEDTVFEDTSRRRSADRRKSGSEAAILSSTADGHSFSGWLGFYSPFGNTAKFGVEVRGSTNKTDEAKSLTCVEC
jgi:hypothetical protein